MIAIHFKLDGPLFYTQALSNPGAHLMRRARGLIESGGMESVLVLWMTREFSAAILLNSKNSGLCNAETLRAAQTPSELIEILKETKFQKKKIFILR